MIFLFCSFASSTINFYKIAEINVRLSCQKKQMLLNVLHTKKASNMSNTSQFQIRQVSQGSFMKLFLHDGRKHQGASFDKAGVHVFY